MRQSRLAAWWITGVGVLHCALFLWVGRRSLRAIAADGIWNTIDPIRERQVLFWALLTGVLALVLGRLALWITKRGHALPSSLGWQLLILTVVSGILMPVSGGWLLLVPAILIILGGSPKSGGDVAPTD